MLTHVQSAQGSANQVGGAAGLRMAVSQSAAAQQRRTRFALAGAIALHIGMAALLVLIGRQALRPVRGGTAAVHDGICSAGTDRAGATRAGCAASIGSR